MRIKNDQVIIIEIEYTCGFLNVAVLLQKAKLTGTKMLVTIHINSNNIPDILKLESNNSLFTKIEKKDSKISIF
jgi:hypothetical protein